MKKLGSVVLLAGKNGAGKTRLLDTIKSQLLVKPKRGEIEQLKRDVTSYKDTGRMDELMNSIRYSLFDICNVETDIVGFIIRNTPLLCKTPQVPNGFFEADKLLNRKFQKK